MFYCEFCSYNDDTSFAQETDFIKHIKVEHLKKYNLKKEIIYRCCYGKNGSCEVLANGKNCDFESEKEYEKHLILNHLKKPQKSKSPFFITDKDILDTSSNYDEVKNNLKTPKKWSFHHSKINLPAVLNDPQNRQLDIFSKTWGESFEKSEIVPCTHLESPDKSFFVPYIKKVRSSKQYRENILKKISAQNSYHLNTDESTKLTSQPSNLPDLETVPKIFFQSDFNLNRRDIFSAVIPIFFSPTSPTTNNFTLLDNTIHHKFSRNISTRPKHHKWITEDNATTRMNDKLSAHLDVIEINIAQQVSKKSQSFFEAVSTQDKVRDKLSQALTQICNVRNKLSSADGSLTKNHLKMLLLIQRKKNFQLLLEKLKIVKAVHSAQTTIQTLLSTNDLCGALDLITDTEHIIDDNLSGNTTPLNCLKHVKPQLQELKMFLHKMVQQEYVNIVSAQLRIEEDWSTPTSLAIDYQMVPSLLAMMRQSTSPPQITKHEHQNLSNNAKAIVVTSESQITNLHSFLRLYYDDAIEVSKTIVRSRVLQAYYRSPSSHNTTCTSKNTDDNIMTNSIASLNCNDESVSGSNNSIAAASNLAEQMRTLNYEEWMELMKIIIDDMLQLVDKVKIGCYTMRETLIHSTKSISTNNDEFNQCLQPTLYELSILPRNVTETLIQRVVKLIKARSKNGYLEKLVPTQFIQLIELLLTMSNKLTQSLLLWYESDEEGNNVMSELNKLIWNCIIEHTTRLVTRFHNDRCEKLQLILDNDLWKPADVPSQLQELANQISQGEGILWADKNGSISTIATKIVGEDQKQTNIQCFEIDGTRYTVAAAALLLFNMVTDYCHCISVLATMCETRTQLLTPVIQLVPNLLSLLKLFNSRSCQLVLGARARKLVELETISARNLAVAARSLDLVLALFPRIRRHFELVFKWDNDFVDNEHVNNKVWLKQLTEVQYAVKDHVNQIGMKLVSLLEERIQNRLANWAGKPPAPSQEIRAICQHLIRLHEAICGILSVSFETELLLSAHTGFKAHLRQRVRELKIVTDNGPRHGIVQQELAFYLSQLTSLCGLKSFQESFSDVWS